MIDSDGCLYVAAATRGVFGGGTGELWKIFACSYSKPLSIYNFATPAKIRNFYGLTEFKFPSVLRCWANGQTKCPGLGQALRSGIIRSISKHRSAIWPTVKALKTLIQRMHLLIRDSKKLTLQHSNGRLKRAADCHTCVNVFTKIQPGEVQRSIPSRSLLCLLQVLNTDPLCLQKSKEICPLLLLDSSEQELLQSSVCQLGVLAFCFH